MVKSLVRILRSVPTWLLPPPPPSPGRADPEKNVIFVSTAVYVVNIDVFGRLKMLAENVSMFLRVLRLTFLANIFKRPKTSIFTT